MRKGKKIRINEHVTDTTANLNQIQRDHLAGIINIYEPIEAYEEKWRTKYRKQGFWEYFDSAYPLPGTRRRSDLPPVYMQWKDAFACRTTTR